jgi:hypothetical protein
VSDWKPTTGDIVRIKATGAVGAIVRVTEETFARYFVAVPAEGIPADNPPEGGAGVGPEGGPYTNDELEPA